MRTIFVSSSQKAGETTVSVAGAEAACMLTAVRADSYIPGQIYLPAVGDGIGHLSDAYLVPGHR